MADIQHVAITDPNIHEPKGVSSAAAGQIYTANGAGSGAWETPAYTTEFLRFIAHSDSTVVVSNDNLTPTYLSGFTLLDGTHFEIADPSTGAVRNISGSTISLPTGSISFNPDNTGGGTATLVTYSENTSDSGGDPNTWTWVKNPGSIRKIEVSSTGESFKTTVSFLAEWEDGVAIRFGTYLEAGGLSFVATTGNPDGEVVSGHSIIWEIGGATSG